MKCYASCNNVSQVLLVMLVTNIISAVSVRDYIDLIYNYIRYNAATNIYYHLPLLIYWQYSNWVSTNENENWMTINQQSTIHNQPGNTFDFSPFWVPDIASSDCLHRLSTYWWLTAMEYKSGYHLLVWYKEKVIKVVLTHWIGHTLIIEIQFLPKDSFLMQSTCCLQKRICRLQKEIASLSNLG